MKNNENTIDPARKIKLSVSAIGTYEKCPKKYWYNYIEKPPIKKQEWSHLEFGSCLHLALEKFHEFLITHQLKQSEYSSLMKKCLESAIKDFNQDLLENDFGLMKSIMQCYLNQIKSDGLPNVLWVERPFEVTIGNYYMKGFMDRVDKIGPGAYRVIDYKTSKNPAYLDKFQLQVYAMVLRDQLPDMETICGSYLLLKHECKTKDWDFTNKDLDDCRSAIISWGDSILNDSTWCKKPSKLCDFCDYKEICLGNWSD